MIDDLIDPLCNPAGTCLACHKTAPIVDRYLPLHGWEPLCFLCAKKFDLVMKERCQKGEESKPIWTSDIIQQML